MSSEHSDPRRATIHLTAQATIELRADQLWPSYGEYSRFGVDLEAFAEEVGRRLRTDGFVGCYLSDEGITMIPFGAIKRIDFGAES
jgi:hypothetical protein